MEKKDNILRYYEAEMRYLEKAAEDFAEAHPDSAYFLKMKDSLERDPMVERLFEGFAFLTAKLYQKIDDDMPELTESAIGLLWPHYLKAIPSMSIIELLLNDQIQTSYQFVPKGLTLQTVIDPETNLSCEYQTTQDIEIYPIDIVDGKLVHNDLGQSIIQIKLQLRNSGFGQDFQLPENFSLKLHFVGEMETKLMLYHFLVNHLSHITTDENFTEINQSLSVNRTHFEAETVTWLNGKNVSEHDLLMEYFLFKEKFLFLEIKGLSGAQFNNDDYSLLINCHLNRDFPLEIIFNKKYFKLFCVPAINLFKLEAEPIIRSHLNTEYKLSPVHSAAEHISIFSVDNVESFSQKTGLRKKYLPFESFRHGKKHLNINDKNPYYYLRSKEGVDKKYYTYISFGGDIVFEDEEILSISILATNDNLPRQISKHHKNLNLLSPVLGVKNAQMVMIPTAMQYPPNFKNQQWQLLFEMGHNYLSTLDIGVLKNSLRLMNWSTSTINEKYIVAIQSLQTHIEHIMHQGLMIRCLIIDIELDITAFLNEADAALFSYALNIFLKGYTQLNLALKVNTTLQPSGNSYNWPMSLSEQV